MTKLNLPKFDDFLENAMFLRHIFKNWLSIGLRFKFSKTNRLKVVLRSGQSYMLWRNYFYAIFPLLKKGMPAGETIENLLNDKIPYNDNIVVIHGWVRENNEKNGDIFNVFIEEEYKFLNAKNRVVVDIGASIGDSPIYFALNGATMVIGLEPYPYTYNFGIKNIKENKLDDKIIFLNAGYGPDREIFLDENKISNEEMDLQPSERGKKLSIYSLKTIVDKFNIDKAVLKMDCEGCEYNLVNEDEKVLKRFSQIQIEYHYGPEKLVEKLRSLGFSVKYSEPKKHFDPYSKNPHMLLGDIYASNLD